MAGAKPTETETTWPDVAVTITKWIALAACLFVLLIGLITIGRYAMIGWDTCSRNGYAPMMIDCVPGVSEPDTWSKCTPREVGIAIAETRDWTARVRDCQMPSIINLVYDGPKAAEPDTETEAIALEVAQTEDQS